MRLLERTADGDFKLTEFFGNSIPPYAILSHTWGPDHEEVTYRDLFHTGKFCKSGHKKIEFCANQARDNGLQYFWVDTCCIDKSSSAELTEAINSMFTWYRNATRCYVYLSDVSVPISTSPIKHISSQQPWAEEFRQSRWFTRGWTLQELIAPLSVEFFSAEGYCLGDKTSMALEIQDITGISVNALLQQSLHELSVKERMSWIAQRKTKREEDAAYSLLGIFDVHMPLIYGEGRKKAFARLQKEIDALQHKENPLPPEIEGLQDESQAMLGCSCPGKSFTTVPFAPDPDFVDRPEILAWIHDKCSKPGARVALVGLGGVGKSQLAIQHTYYVRSRMPLTYVFWVHASTRARFEEAYKGLADRLELPGRDDQTIDVLRLVSSWLCDEKNGQWTMVLDNVDNVENFFPSRKRKQDEAAKGLPAPLMAYLPQSPNGSILITSRNKDVAAKLTGGHHNLKEIPAMKESEGLQLLRNKLSEASYNEDTAVQLLRMLDHVPLIITQAAAYINRRARMTIGTYLKEFCANNKRREVLLSWDAGDLRRDESASNSVIVTWEISFERIRQDRRSAAELLSIMSYFNPQGIPERTLQGYNTLSAEIDAPGNKGEAECTFNEDLDTLHAYSLIMPTKTKVTGSVDVETWEMHPLVQFCTQLWLSSTGELERRRMSFVELLAQEFPNPRFDNRMECGQLFPHVAPLFDLEPNSEHLSKAWAQILTNTGKYLSMQGNYRMAQAVLDKAVKARGRVLGLNNDQTLRSVGILASALQHQGKYEEAEKLNWQVLKGRERGLGILHLETLTTVNNLALVLYHRGRYEEAEKLNRRALEGREKKLGEDHLDTLTSVNNLAIVLRYQGKYEESEKLNHRALDGRRKELGEHHPHTLTTLANLALVLKSEKKYEEAENLSRQALEGAAKELGTHHPETLTKMYNLAYLLHTMDQHDEAAQLYQQAHSGLVQVLGPQHPQTIVCNKNFASLKQKTKQGSL